MYNNSFKVLSINIEHNIIQRTVDTIQSEFLTWKRPHIFFKCKKNMFFDSGVFEKDKSIIRAKV